MSRLVDLKALSTPDIPTSRARVTLYASTIANAAAVLCFRKVLDTSVWRDWNRLVPEVTIRSQPGGDEWESLSISENPGAARVGMASLPPPLQNKNDSRIGAIKGFGLSQKPGAAPNSSPENLVDSDLLVGTKDSSNRGDGSHDSSVQKVRRISITTIGGEPSVRLRRGTAMTFHVIPDPSKPHNARKSNLLVTDLVRPTDQPLGEQPVYRVMWESDSGLAFPSSPPKWLLFSQRVTEVGPVIRGDGKEDCEITTWECQRGLLARIVRKYHQNYLQSMFEQNVQGLKEYCEAMGGAVDRRDFSISVTVSS